MCQDVSRNYRWKVARIKGVHFPILIFWEKNLEIRLLSQKFLLHLIMMSTNSSYIYVSDVFSWSLQSNKKRRMTFLKLKVPVLNVIKCWGQLCSRILTRPRKVQLMFTKTNICQGWLYSRNWRTSRNKIGRWNWHWNVRKSLKWLW